MRCLEAENTCSFPVTRSMAREKSVPGVAGCSAAVRNYSQNNDGYWNNEKITQQIKEFIRCAELKHAGENVQRVLLFDWSYSHAAMSEDAPVVSNMGWKFGRKQPKMHPAVTREHYPCAKLSKLREEGSVQLMTFGARERPHYHSDGIYDDNYDMFGGVAKGLNQVLWERGLLTDDMTKNGQKD